MAGLNTPLTVTAHLQQGVVLDPLFGTALDGLLASVLRDRAKSHASTEAGHPVTGSLLDGGLSADTPAEVPLPLARCSKGVLIDSVPPSGWWHWAATTAYPVGFDHELVTGDPDVHYETTRVKERTAEQIALRLPMTLPPASGRYRMKRLPVVTTPCASLMWRAVGNPDVVADLVGDIYSLGKRRHTGEGTVLGWTVTPHLDSDPTQFAHLHPNGTLGRPTPEACVTSLGLRVDRTGTAGLRPPYWHPATQHLLVLPEPFEGTT